VHHVDGGLSIVKFLFHVSLEDQALESQSQKARHEFQSDLIGVSEMRVLRVMRGMWVMVMQLLLFRLFLKDCGVHWVVLELDDTYNFTLGLVNSDTQGYLV
jgi:hypothetical protein